MTCTCSIIPASVLERLALDTSLTDEIRAGLAHTARIDAEVRKLRTQNGELSRVMHAVGVVPQTLAAAPSILVYTCRHGMTLPGAAIANPAASTDASAGRAFGETTGVADFYKQVFNRNSVDDAGLTLVSSIHYGAKYNNAFWNGAQMVYGDGDGQIFIDFTGGNDVIGHELTHGVTQHSLQLNYVDEPGGLNESISDVFGSMFRQWQAGQEVTAADWVIGKDIMGPAAHARGYTCLRDMADPAAAHCLSPQPTQYSQFKPGMDPHESSGIPNLAFYKVAMGIGGKSWEKAGQIWYKALTGYGPNPTMSMRAFANQTRQAAAQLYPGDAATAAAVDQGWKQVGL